ncbi:MAG: HAD family phosphatase [Clostridia bacterium]|nr:HAD family phosphatase [Clostridia bacterium]
MPKNLVFDIGNVLVDYRLKEFLAAKGFDGMMIKRILKASIMSPYWEQFERCELTEEEAFRAFATLDPEIDTELRTAFSNVHGMLTIRDFAVPYVRALKEAGYHVYYFSNYSKKAYDECADSLAFMEYTDGGYLSWQVKMTKPNPRMYDAFLAEYALDPAECVFVDDTPENVEEAERHGFRGIVFSSYEDMLDKLAAMGITVKV